MNKRRLLLLIAVVMVVFVSGSTLVSYAAVGNPTTSGDVTTWDCVYFGYYPQSYIDSAPVDLESSYNLEQIKWRVLNVKDNRALLLADKVIDAAKFSDKYTHKYVYAEAPIFSHMEELKKKMFTSQEASALCSKDIDSRIAEPGLLLLPSKEIMKNTNYGFPANEDRTNTRGAASTDYVKKYLGYDKGYWIKYWLSDLNPGDHGVVFSTIR